MKGKCIECGEEATQLHHVIPRAIKRDASATVPLCDGCHALLHGKKERRRTPMTDHRHLTVLGLERSSPATRLQLVAVFLCDYLGGNPEDFGVFPESYASKLERVRWLTEHDPEYIGGIFKEFADDLRRPGDRIDPVEYWNLRDNPGAAMQIMVDAYSGHQTDMFN